MNIHGENLEGKVGQAQLDNEKILINTDNYSFSTKETIAVAIHEAGHTLFLSHPDENRIGYHPVSIMNSFMEDGMYYPTLYDEYNLKKVWG